MAFEQLALLWIVLPVFFALRLGIAFIDKGMSKSPSESEQTFFETIRVHNITLSGFVIVGIALIIGFDPANVSKHIGALFFLSIGMFCFFTTAYLVSFSRTRWLPYIGRTLEYTGILSMAIGFAYLIAGVVESDLLNFAYILFFFVILSIAAYDLFFNMRIRLRNR